MIITLVMVASLNGKITRRNDPDIYKWTSEEDHEFFFNKVKEAKLIIMGSGTYQVVSPLLKHKPGKLRVVLTRNVEKYKKDEVQNVIEFSNQDPKTLVKSLENREYEEALLVGGAEVNKSFIEKGLVDYFYITLEPFLFGQGKNMILDGEFETPLKLVEMQKLNEKGTVLLKYKVEK